MRVRVLALTVASVLVAGLAAVMPPAMASPRQADLVLHSGVVWTGHHGRTAEAVAIEGDRIVAVGSDHRVLRYAGRHTRTVDLNGAFVAPGFRDQHTHLLEVAAGGGTAEDYRPAWEGYDPDAAFEGRRRVGQRHVDLHERGGNPMDECRHSPVTDELKNNLLVMQDEVASQGLSTVVEAGLHDLGVWDALRELSREGRLKVRFLVRVAAGCMEEAAQLGLRTGVGDEWVKVLGVKLYADGWLGPRTAALREPYNDDPYGFPPRGILFLDQDEATREVLQARALGFHVTTHAIGDRAVRTVLDAYENARVTRRDRWSIEHVQVAADDLTARMARRGVIASIQLSFATTDQRFAEDALGAERLDEAGYRWRTMLDQRVRLAGGSDFSVEVLDPLWGVQRVVTRREFDGTPPGGFQPEQRLRVPTALRLITSADAYASFEERERGTIRNGSYADLVVVRENLLTMPQTCIASATRLMTITNGRITSRRPVSYPPGGILCRSG